MNRVLAAAATAAFLAAGIPAAHALPVTKRVLAEKTKLVELSIAYPQTGVKAIDDDIRATVAKRVREFDKLAQDQSDDTSGGVFTEDTNYTIARNDGQVFSVTFQSLEDFHGAHPSHEYFTANYVLPDGWRVFLPEIVDGARGLSRISALARADLDKKLLAGKEPVSDKDWIAKGTEPAAPNFDAFTLLPAGLRIQFESYQVACYACGDPTVDIPMAALTGVLRANWRLPAASFACERASAPIERTICSDPLLARLDRQVAEEYFTRIGETKEGALGIKVEALKTAQRNWLAQRNACAAQVACLMTLYRDRLEALEGITL
jgi:uncharacterized protein YecT (DUF1311 family)